MIHDPEVELIPQPEAPQPTEVSEILHDAGGALRALGDQEEDIFQETLGQAVHDNLLRQLRVAKPYLQHPNYDEQGNRSELYYQTLENGLGYGRTGQAARKIVSDVVDVTDRIVDGFLSGELSWADVRVDAKTAKYFKIALGVLSHLSGNSKSGRGLDTYFKQHPPKFPPLMVVDLPDNEN